jgi:trans-aconitate methyltransferase
MPAISADELIEWLNPQPGERILDAGCGLGQVSAKLAARGAHVTGVEIVGPLLEQARFACPPATFVHVDLLEYAPAEPFDALIAHALLHWLQPADKVAKRLAGLLKPGGRMVASLGGACPAAAELAAYQVPDAKKHRKTLEKAGFERIELRENESGFALLAFRKR